MSDGFIPGLSGKMNTQEMIEKIMESKKPKIEKLEKEKDTIIDKRKLMQEVGTKAYSLQGMSKRLFGIDAPFDEKITLSTDESAFSAKAEKQAEIGVYQLEITQIARAHKIASSSLGRSFKISKGTYRIKVGGDEAKIPFSGGSIDDFDEAIKKNAKDILISTVTYDTSKTQVLILSGRNTGSENAISFPDEKTKAVFKEMGFIKEKSDFEYSVPFKRKLLTDLTLENKNPRIKDTNSIQLLPKDVFNYSLDQKIAYRKGLTMEVDIRLIGESELVEEAVLKEHPTGPNFEEIGNTYIMEMQIEGEPQLLDIPPYNGETKEKEKTGPVNNDHYIEIKTNRRTIELDETKAESTNKTFSFNLGELLTEGESITDVVFKNRNSEKNIEISNVQFFDNESRGNLAYLRELSKPADAKIKIDGLEITRDSNTIDDLLKGITLSVYDETNDREYLKVDRDYETIVTGIVEFIGEYNGFLEMVNENTDSNPDEEGNRGTLSDEYGLRSLTSRMRMIMMNAYVTDYGTELATLNQIGISTNVKGGFDATKLKGILEVDEDKFIAMMEKFPEGIKQLFGNDTNNDYLPDSGASYEMHELLKVYTRNYFKGKDETYSRNIEDQDKRIESAQEKLDDEEMQLRRDFIKWDRAVQEMDQNSQRMNNMFNNGSK